MSAMLDAVRESAGRVFAAVAGLDFAGGWSVVAANGLAGMLLPENPGWEGFAAVAELAGYHAVGLPVGEAMIGAAALTAMGLPATGVISVGEAVGDLADGRFTGVVCGVPWGADSAVAVAESGGAVFAVEVRRGAVTRGQNVAGEARDSLLFRESVVLGVVPAGLPLLWQVAVLRAAQSAGALRRALALLAEESAACGSAAAGAAAVLADGGDAGLAVAAAKLRACRAAEAGAAIAHQVHGAIGFTQDYALQRYTRRLAAWRGEAGNERYWAEVLGARVAAAGADAIWDLVTGSV